MPLLKAKSKSLSDSKTNRAAQIVGGVIEAIMQGGEDAALAFLAAEVRIFANPVGKALASWVFGYVAGPIETYLVNNATGIVINIQTSTEQTAVINAATALQLAQASGDPAAIEEAVKNAKAAYSKLFRWDGVFSS